MKWAHDPPAKQRSSKWRVAWVVSISLVLGTMFVFWWLAPHALPLGFDASEKEAVAWIRSWGAWGVLASIALMVAHSFLPFPSEVIALANGMVYGPFWGSVITWVGAMLGASAAFGLARLLGRPFVERFIPPESRQRLARWSHEHGGHTLLMSRLIPLIAFNLINYAAALTRISWWTFLWATALGILPLTVLLAILGDRMLSIPFSGWLILSLVIVVAGILLIRHRSKSQHQDINSDSS
jgi:uncharacterized membrane protein YdjX (TVP38/TMEM64 family)